MSERRRDDGQALVLLVLGMVVLLGFVGLAFDLGVMRLQRRQLQVLADAAAIAGAQELTYCTTNNCSALTTAAQNALTENGFTGSTLITQCGSSTANLTVMVNNPPCQLGATDAHNGDKHYVEVVVAQKSPTYFASIFGIKSEMLSARAEANLPGGSSCVFSLNPNGQPGMQLWFGDFTSQCGIVDESQSTGFFSPAFLCVLGIFNAPYIGVVGDSDWIFCNNGGGANPVTGINTPSPADPLAYLQSSMISAAPSPSNCGTTNSSPYTGHNGALTLSHSATLNPGTYCGGITINPGANVTFNPGIYTLTSIGSAGGLTIDPVANVTGNGVAFYNHGPNGGINFVFSSLTPGNVTLTAPTGGAYSGILFFQDPIDTASSVVVGASSWNTKLTGASYFPNADVNFALDVLVDYDIVVAKDVFYGFQYQSVNVSTHFYNNYSSLVNGTPIKATAATLAE